MWGSYIRGAFALGCGALFAAMLAFVLSTMAPILQSGADDAPAEANAGMVTDWFASVETWFALIVLVSVIVFVLGRSVLENRLGGV